jgi:hypothetical protein
VIQSLPSKHEALSSLPKKQTTNKQTNKKKWSTKDLHISLCEDYTSRLCPKFISSISNPVLTTLAHFHLATWVSWQPLTRPRHFWPQGLCCGLLFRPHPCPTCRGLSGHKSQKTSPGTLINFSVCILCVALATFCYFLIYCLLLLPESKFCKSMDPSVTTSPASNSMPGTLNNDLLNEQKRWHCHYLQFTAMKTESGKGEGTSPRSHS